MTDWNPPRTGLAFLSVLALGALPVQGQQADPADSDAPEVVELSPFMVETDRDMGYMATNSISGTRLNMEIKDVPMNLDVVTSDFIQDTGATDLRESLRYSAGVVLESQSDALQLAHTEDPQGAGANDPRGATRRKGDSSTKLRGFVNDSVLEDGLRRNFSADSINIARVEVVRGPSALLYGIGNFGGVINFVTKKPMFDDDIYHLGFGIGSRGFIRSEFDFTGPLVSKESSLAKYRPAYRITGAYEESEDFTDYYDSEHWTIAPSFSFQPTKTTFVNIDLEFGDKKETGVGFQTVRSNSGDAADAAAYWVTDIFDYNEETQEVTRVGEKVDTRTFRWSGPDTYLKGPYDNLKATIEQHFGDNVIFRIGASHSDTTFDSLQVNDAHIIANPFTSVDTARAANLLTTTYKAGTFSTTEPAEQPDTTLAYKWLQVDQDEDRDQIRFEAVYDVDLDSWGRHTVILGSQYQNHYTESTQHGFAYSYADHYVPTAKEYSFHNPDDLSVIRRGVQGDGQPDPDMIPLYHNTNESWDLGYYAVYQGQFFSDSLTAVGGLRWDRSDGRKMTDYLYEDRDTEWQYSLGASTSTSPQLGLSYAITDAVSVFGVYSTGASPNYYDYDGYGNMMPTTKAKNYEVGVKVDLMDGRLSGTVSAFKIKRENVPWYVWWAPNPYKSVKEGYDPSAPTTTVAWYNTPDAWYYGLHESGLDPATALETAKQIWPEAFWGLIDEVAAYNGPGPLADDFESYGPLSSAFWDGSDPSTPSLDVANENTTNPDYSGNIYFPLVNYNDPEVYQFMQAVHASPGWKGNFYGDQGATYHYGDGSLGTYNSPSGSGASVPIDDQSTGWDLSMIWTPIDDFQVKVNFSHLNRKITTRTFKFVSLAEYFTRIGFPTDEVFVPGASWYASDNAYGSYDNQKTYVDVYDNPGDTSTYNQTIPYYNQSGDDSPENTASIWMHYNLRHLSKDLDGWGIGLGGYWEDNRLWSSGFAYNNVNFKEDTRELAKNYTKERFTFNGMIEYNTRINDAYNLRVALNVDNIFDDEELYGLIYAPGRVYKMFVSVDF